MTKHPSHRMSADIEKPFNTAAVPYVLNRSLLERVGINSLTASNGIDSNEESIDNITEKRN